jgi:hypothetical protein
MCNIYLDIVHYQKECYYDNVRYLNILLCLEVATERMQEGKLTG